MKENDKDRMDETLHWVSKAQAGDADAFQALYALYEKRLSKAVRRGLGAKLRARMETEDLIQSVWKDVLTDMNGFEYRGKESFFRWLLLRVIRKIQDKGRYFATKKRNVEQEEQLQTKLISELIGPKANQDPTPSQVVMKDEELNRLMRLLDHLPDPQRQVLVHHIRDDLSFEEIGKKLEKSPGAVRQLYYRALKKINSIYPKMREDA